jgi:sucrose-6F-phosphate phosphohydrolase
MKAIIFSDLDRTIIPNGSQPESTAARPLLRQLVDENKVKLVYVSGRSQELLKEAINRYKLPVPDFAIGDVGTSIYHIDNQDWQLMPAWQAEIAAAWQGRESADLQDILSDLNFLTLQEPGKQNLYKISYYIEVDANHRDFGKIVTDRLATQNIRAAVITSVDESKNQAFLDILPENATKLHAVRFLMRHLNYNIEQAVFCGDSGNDLPVLESEIQSVLVANAIDEVRNAAVLQSDMNGNSEKLYLAKGKFALNGNYSSGVLEGAAHFISDINDWLENK